MRAEDITDRESFKRWLDARPEATRRWEGSILALRSALRVMPLVVPKEWQLRQQELPFILRRRGSAVSKDEVPQGEGGVLPELTATILRCIVLARSINLAEDRASTRLRRAAARAVAAAATGSSTAATAAFFAAVAAVYASTEAPASTGSSSAVDAVARAAPGFSAAEAAFYSTSATAVLWAALRADAAVIEREGHRALLTRPLWPAEAPRPKGLADPAPFRKFLAAATNGHVWTRWYDRVLAGRVASDEEEMLYADEALDDLWQKKDGYLLVSQWLADRLAELDAKKAKSEAELEALTEQQEAAFRFEVKDDMLVALPGSGEAFDPDFAELLRAEVVAKLESLLARHGGSNVVGAMKDKLERLRKELGNSVSEIKDGLLLSASRGVLADRDTYGTAEYRNELMPEVYSTLQDMGASLEDLIAAFPRIRIIERNRIALGLVKDEASLTAVKESLSEFTEVVQNSEAAQPSAKRAISQFDAQIDEEQKIELLSEYLGDKTLVARNAVSRGYRAIRHHPGTRFTLLSLMALLSASFRKLAKEVPDLKPLHDELAKTVAEKLNGKPLEEPKPAEETKPPVEEPKPVPKPKKPPKAPVAPQRQKKRRTRLNGAKSKPKKEDRAGGHQDDDASDVEDTDGDGLN